MAKKRTSVFGDINAVVRTATKPSRVPKTVDKKAVIFAAEENLAPWEVPSKAKPVPKTVAPYRRGAGPRVTPKEEGASLDERYTAAKASPVSVTARKKLVKTMSPERRRELRAKQQLIEEGQARRDAQQRPISPPPSYVPTSRPGDPSGLAFGPTRPTAGYVPRAQPVTHDTHPRSTLSRLRSVVEPVLPIDKGHLGQPEVIQRGRAVLDVAATGLIEGGKFAGAQIADRIQEDPNNDIGAQVRQYEVARKAREKQLRRPLTVAEAQKLGASMFPQSGLHAQNLINAAASIGGIAVGAYNDPVGVAKDIAKMGASATVGTGLLVAALSRPDLSYDQRAAMLAQMPASIQDEYTKHFGRGLNAFEAFDRAKEDPVGTALLYPLPISAAAQGGRILALTRLGLHGGKDLKTAVRLARDPERQRLLTYTERAPKGSGVETVRTQVPGDWSSSVLTRNVLQRPYDLGSKALDALPGARALPVAMSKRAASQQGKTFRRQKMRLGAEAHAAFTEVNDFINGRNLAGQKSNKHYATTLAVLVQKPEGFTNEEWESAVIQNLKDMRADPENMHLPGDEISPAEQKIINRIARYDKKAEAGRARKRGLGMRRLHNDQRRMGENLARITKEREDLHDEWLAHQQDKVMVPAAWDDENAKYEGALRALDSEAKVMREQLDDISVAQPPIDSPQRDQLRQTMERLVYFKDYPQAVEDVLFAGDAVARNWAKEKGRTPEEWWERRHIGGVVDPDSIPQEAYAQTRQATDVPDPAALDAKAQEIYDRYSHLSGSMPPGVTNAAEFAAKGHEVARLAQLGADHKDWYRDSGLAIRDRLGPNNWKEARQISAAVAYLSRTDSVMANVGHAMRAYTSYKETGDAGLAGRYPSVANAKLNEIFKNDAWGGYKTNSFFRNILEEYDPARFKKEFGKADDNVELDLGDAGEEVTVDRWIVRAFGFADNNVGGKGRYFAAREMIQHIASQLGWTPKQVQAAIWVAVKAESEAAKSVEKVAARNVVNKGKYDAKVAKAAETGRGGPRSEWEPEEPKTAEDFLAASGVHVGTSLDRITHQLRVNAEAAPGSTYAGFPEYATFSPFAQEEFAAEIARGVYDYHRKLGLPFRPGERGPGLFEPPGAPIETNPAFAVNISVGSAMRQSTAEKYGLERVPDWQRREFDAIVAGQGRGTKQNAMPWLRPLVSENMGEASAAFVERANLSTDDMLALRGARGDADWQIAIGHGDGGVWFSLVKDAGMPVEEFRGKVSTILDEAFGADVEHSVTAYAHEGGYVENDWKKGADDYEVAIGDSRRPEAIRAASDALTDHYESARVRFTSHPDGPDGAARQHRANRLARSRRADDRRGLDPPAAGPLQSQTRRNDTLGATQLLNSATGERIIWLTEHSDFSTVLHELLGHASDEMKDLYPEEFAKVEQVIGRDLDVWTVADHEKFATWFERYLYEGHAPTPELVPVFDRAKQYMRVIYEQIRRALGGRIPHATRDLFDHYLGGWDSESSTRIAVNMGHYGPSDSPYAGARLAAQEELGTLQKRNRTRRFNRSQEGMLEELKRLEKQADKGVDNQEERDALAAQIVRLQAEIIMRSDKRVQSLHSKISDMEKALTRDPDNRRFGGALEASKFLMEDRTRILKQVFGEDYHALFDNREDLLANYLVQHGLLQPDFEHGTGTYFPMKLDEGFLQSLKLPMQPASNRVIGKVQQALAGVHHRNEMIRWQAGDWSADPGVLQLAHARALSYQFILEVRELMHEMGRQLTHAEQLDPKRALPSGGYVVNLKGTPLSPDMKAATRGMTNTTTTDHLDDGLFGDNAKLENSLKSYFENSIIDLDALPPGFDLGDPELRFVSKAAVNRIFRPVNLNVGGKAWDAASTAARFALIYANAPGYMITNLAGNLVFLTMQQGVNWIPRMVVYSKMLLNDTYFRERVKAEGGMLPAFSAITRGRNFGQRAGQAATAAERKWLEYESVVDSFPRMIAWMAEANKKGYWSKESMIRLLDGKSEKTHRDREYVAERTNQHMIDFTFRVSDRERQTLGRLLFIWPYIRGATAMPFWYGKNYPGRTALLMQLSLQQRQYQEAMLGDLPPGREDLYPYSRKGGKANVVSTRYFNPAGPLPDEIKLASDIVAGSFGRTPDNLSARLASLLNVNVENTIGVVTGKDAFGHDVSLKEQVLQPYGIADSLAPFERYFRAAFDDRYVPRAFREGEGDTTRERVSRSILRVPEQTVSVDWLNASAQSQGTKTTSEKIESAVTANKLHFHAAEGASTPYPNALRKQVAAKVIYDDRVYALERDQAAKAAFVPKLKDDGEWDFGYHADTYDRAVVAYAVMKKTMPEVFVEHPSLAVPPNEYLLESGTPPRSVKGLDLSDKYVTFFNDMVSKKPNLKGVFSAVDYDARYTEQQTRQKYFKEKRAGAYG